MSWLPTPIVWSTDRQPELFEQQVSPDEQVTIPARQVIGLHFPVKISYQYLTAVLPEGRKQASCLVTGDMYFRNEK